MQTPWQLPTINAGYGLAGKAPGFVPTLPGRRETWNANMDRIMNGIHASTSGKTTREGGNVGKEDNMDFIYEMKPPPTTEKPEEHAPMWVRIGRPRVEFLEDEKDDSKRPKIENDMDLVD